MYRALRTFMFSAFFGAALLCVPGAASAAEPISVHVDEAAILRLPENIGTIIVGNPLIADVAVQSGGLVVVTGKGYGTTNLLALDRQGNVLLDKTVLVAGPTKNTLVVYRGADRATYSCEPRCEPRITLGDSPDYFTATMGQASARATQAGASGNGGGGGQGSVR